MVTDVYYRNQVFQKEELVMAYVQQTKFPNREYHKFWPKNLGPSMLNRRQNNNVYVFMILPD